MQLTTKSKKEEVSKITKLGNLLFKPIVITSYDIFPSQYRPGKEVVRIQGWVETSMGVFEEFNIPTESKLLVATLKELDEPGDTVETMVVMDRRTSRYFFSNITKDQQKRLRDKIDEERKQYYEQNLAGLFDQQGSVSDGAVQCDGEDLQGTSGTTKD